MQRDKVTCSLWHRKPAEARNLKPDLCSALGHFSWLFNTLCLKARCQDFRKWKAVIICYYETYLMSWLTSVSFSPEMVIIFYCHLSDVICSGLTCKTGKVSYKAFLKRNELRGCIALLFQTLSVFKLQWGVKSVLLSICHWLGCGPVFCSRDVEWKSCVSLGSIGGHCHLLSPLPEIIVWLSSL